MHSPLQRLVNELEVATWGNKGDVLLHYCCGQLVHQSNDPSTIGPYLQGASTE